MVYTVVEAMVGGAHRCRGDGECTIEAERTTSLGAATTTSCVPALWQWLNIIKYNIAHRRR